MPSLRDQVAQVNWYHTIELPDGIVTPGRWDTRRAVQVVDFPETLEGARCLDVGTWDGFWAFEMERRNASEVVAIDLDDVDRWDWPATGSQAARARFRAAKNEDSAFDIAHRALDSKVDRRTISIYDVSPELLGRFDFVFAGSILLHLRDPVKALTALRSVVGGKLLAADQISLTLSLVQPRRPTAHLAGTLEPHWWTPSIACFHRYFEAAGYDVSDRGGVHFLRPGPGAPPPGRSLRSRVQSWVGLPHASLTAHPATESTSG